MENAFMQRIRRFESSGNTMESVYSFERGPLLEKVLAMVPKDERKRVFIFWKDDDLYVDSVKEGTPGWCVRIDDHFVYFKVGTVSKEDFKEMFPLFERLMRLWICQPKQDDILKYWENPDDELNGAELYLDKTFEARSHYLSDLIKAYLPETTSALEIGCNVGRNLNILNQNLGIAVGGIDINPKALTLLKTHYPNIANGSFSLGNIPDVIQTIPDQSFDLVYSMAVLMHLHPTTPDSFWHQVTRVAKHGIITIENEQSSSNRNWERNYKDLFEPCGVQEIFSETCSHPLLEFCTARIFKKKAAL